MSFQVMAEGSRDLSGDPIWIFDPDLYVKHVETADLNDDNIADIIAAEYDMTYYGNLSRVYAIDGPTGDTLWTYLVNDGIRSMTIGDINNDNVPDVIAGTSYHSTTSPDGRVHAIDGATGAQLWTYNTGASTQDVTIGDFNGDVYMDVAIGSFDDHVHTIDGQNGTQLWAIDIGSMWINAVSAMDVTGDLTDDVAFAHEYLAGYSNHIGVLDGTDGSTVWDSVVAWVAQDVLLADIDDDDVIEAIFSGLTSDDRGLVQVRTASTGQLEWQYDFGAIDHTNGEIWLYAYDLDSDTDLDLVLGNNLGKRRIYAFEGDSNSPMFISDTLEGYPRDLAFGDVTGDGDLNIVASCWDRVQVISFATGAPLWYYGIAGTLRSVAVGDVDDNDTLDVIAGGGADNVGTPPNPGKGVWALRTATSPVLWEFVFGEYGNALAVDDLTGDNFMDVAVVSSDDQVWAIDGQTGTQLWTWVGTANLYAVTTGDFDGDGQVDVAVAGYDEMVTALDGSDGGMMWQFTSPASQIYRNCLKAADLTGDGKISVIAGCDDSYVYAIHGTTGQEIWSTDVGTRVGEVELAQMNGTGPVDVVVAVESGDTGEKMVVLDGAGGGILWEYQAPEAVQHIEVLEVTRDGSPDVALGVTPFEPKEVIMVDGETHTELWSKPMPLASSVYGFAHGDLNNDGVEDLVVPGNSTDRNVYALSGDDGHQLWLFPTGGEINCLVVEDMDGNEQLDVIVGSDDQIVYILNGLTGTSYWEYSTAGDVMHIQLGDISGNNAPNIACVTFDSDGIAYAFDSFYDGPTSCCVETTGNIQLEPNCSDPDQAVDISDLTYMIDHLFISYAPICCLDEADIAPIPLDGQVDVSDLTELIDHLFISYPPLPECP